MPKQITQNLVRKILKEELHKIIKTNESLLNPFTLPENLRSNVLMEGYFRTLDIETTADCLRKRYGDAADVTINDNSNGIKVFRVVTADSDVNKRIIDRDMSLCGYYPAMVSKLPNELMDIQYEPRFQNKVNDEVFSRDKIYHLTRSVSLDKILSIGLTPRTCNKQFNYPDRIYFFLDQPSISICRLLVKQFNIDSANKGKPIYNGNYSLLEIDTKYLKDNNFFFDPNAENCVYTKHNVKPKAIKVIETFKQCNL